MASPSPLDVTRVKTNPDAAGIFYDVRVGDDVPIRVDDYTGADGPAGPVLLAHALRGRWRAAIAIYHHLDYSGRDPGGQVLEGAAETIQHV